jgi:cytochrome c
MDALLEDGDEFYIVRAIPDGNFFAGAGLARTALTPCAEPVIQSRRGSLRDSSPLFGFFPEPGLKGATMTRMLVLVAMALAASAGMAGAQDMGAGEQSFRKCLPCHSVGEDAKNKIGPVLNGLDGRKAGTVDGYTYSEANKNSGITWNEEVFKDYIKDPRVKISGTKMVFAGIKNEKEAGDLWAYLKQFGPDGHKK